MYMYICIYYITLYIYIYICVWGAIQKEQCLHPTYHEDLKKALLLMFQTY